MAPSNSELCQNCPNEKDDGVKTCGVVSFLLQVIECLKENKRQLTVRCHQRIFKLQEEEMADPELDYQLMKVCKHMIKVGPHMAAAAAATVAHVLTCTLLLCSCLAAVLPRVRWQELPAVPEAEQEQRADGPKVQADDHQKADDPEQR